MAIDPETSRQRLMPRYSAEEYRTRPKDYDPDLCNDILEHIMNGEQLPQACERPWMPLPGTFLKWCALDPNLMAEYDAATKIGVDVAVMLAPMAAQMPITGPAFSKALNTYAEKMHPEKYGARSIVRTPPPEEPENGGLSHAADVRRKIDELAKRLAAEASATKEDSKPGS